MCRKQRRAARAVSEASEMRRQESCHVTLMSNEVAGERCFSIRLFFCSRVPLCLCLCLNSTLIALDSITSLLAF